MVTSLEMALEMASLEMVMVPLEVMLKMEAAVEHSSPYFQLRAACFALEEVPELHLLLADPLAVVVVQFQMEETVAQQGKVVQVAHY